MASSKQGKPRRISRPAQGEPADLYNDPAYASELEDWTAVQAGKLGRTGQTTVRATQPPVRSGHGELDLPLDEEGNTGDPFVDGLVGWTKEAVKELDRK